MKQDEVLKLENQLCFPLYACTRQVINLYTPYLKPLGITYTQYLVLLVLWENNTIPMGELCQKLYLDSGTLTPLLKKLEKAGYLTKERSLEDERCVMIHLTKKGKELKKECASIPMKVGSCIKLTEREASEFYKTLYKILNYGS